MDDIEFKYSTNVCNFIPSEALLFSTTTVTPTTPTTTTSEPSLLEFDCHFEEPCLWTNARANRFNWTVMTAAEAAQLSPYAPEYDHTLLTDQGSLLTAMNGSTLQSSFYLSPSLNGSKCFEFWYYQYGPQVQTNKYATFIWALLAFNYLQKCFSLIKSPT